MIGFLWNNVLIDPMTNSLIALDQLLFGSFGLAIIAFTILIRTATFPLTMRQLRSTRAMSELQPKIQEIQKKYKDPKRRGEETMKLYKEAGVNPLGCLGPMIIQLPIWFALYQVIRLTLAGAPENYIDLSQRLYAIPYIQHAVPVSDEFLWMQLGSPDIVLPILVAASMWAQQRSMTLRNTATQTPQQQQTNTMMLWMMPIMFGWFSLTVPSGLALYWFATNLIGIVLNGFVFGFRELHPARMFNFSPSPAPSVSSRTRSVTRTATPPAASPEEEERTSDEPAARGKRKNRRRSR